MRILGHAAKACDGLTRRADEGKDEARRLGERLLEVRRDEQQASERKAELHRELEGGSHVSSATHEQQGPFQPPA